MSYYVVLRQLYCELTTDMLQLLNCSKEFHRGEVFGLAFLNIHKEKGLPPIEFHFYFEAALSQLLK